MIVLSLDVSSEEEKRSSYAAVNVFARENNALAVFTVAEVWTAPSKDGRKPSENPKREESILSMGITPDSHGVIMQKFFHTETDNIILREKEVLDSSRPLDYNNLLLPQYIWGDNKTAKSEAA
jgi:hypothetical protein